MSERPFSPMDVARFWDAVECGGVTECWLWLRRASAKGYGVFYVHGAEKRAHRISVVLSGRAIPDGMVVDHICRNRRCVNPNHLRVVTPRENALENNAGPTAQNAAKTHCKRGHALVPGNLRKDRCRSCAICARGREAKRRTAARFKRTSFSTEGVRA